MIFVGGGAQGASPEVRELAERLGAPVVAGWMGQGVMDGRSELSLNITAAHRLWTEVDVALAVGSRFQRVQMDWGLDEALKVIRIDLDPSEIARHARPEVALLADAGTALRALLPQIRATERAAWRARVAETRAEVQALLRRELAPQLGFIDAIRGALPEDGILVEDLTQIGYVARLAFPVHGPASTSPAAIRARSASPTRPRSAPRSPAPSARWSRSPATAASCTTSRSSRPRRNTASTSSPWSSTTTPTATSSASSASSTATA